MYGFTKGSWSTMKELSCVGGGLLGCAVHLIKEAVGIAEEYSKSVVSFIRVKIVEKLCIVHLNF